MTPCEEVLCFVMFLNLKKKEKNLSSKKHSPDSNCQDWVSGT